MSWWQRLWRRNELERNLDAELRYHIDRQVDDFVRTGMSRRDARRAVRLEFGGLDQVKEDCRDARGTRWIEDVGRDLGFAARLFARERSFTLGAAIVLALGVGVNGMFLTLVEMICIRGLPIERPDRVLFVSTRDARGRAAALSLGEFDAAREASPAFSNLAAFALAPTTVGDTDRAPDRFTGAFVSAAAFGIVGEAPLAGRDFRPDDDRRGAAPVVILGSRVWQGRYGRDPSIVGRTIRIDGRPATVVGVMPDGFRFPTNADLWQPLASMPAVAGGDRDARVLSVFGRLADGAAPVEARDQLAAVAARLARERPGAQAGVRLEAQPINARYNGDISQPAWMAFISAGTLVLLLACANVANLLLMRATARVREIALRASLGATRGRVVRQLLAESALLALLGGAAGFGLAVAGLRAVSTFVPTDVLPYWMDFRLDGPVILVLAAMTIGTSVGFGLVPALHLSRTDVYAALKDGGRGAGAPARTRWWGSLFLGAQVAVALLLLFQLSLVVDLSGSVRRQDPPIETARLLTTSVSLPGAAYPTAADRAAFYERLDRRLAAIGAVSSAAFATALPLGGGAPRDLAIESVPAGNVTAPAVLTLGVGPSYFATLGLPILRGRALDDRDGTPGHETVVVNERFVEMFLAGSDPIGRRIRLTTPGREEPGQWLTIVGVSPSVRQRTLPDPDPVAYLPFRAAPPATAFLVVRGPDDPAATVPALREAARAVDPDVPLYRVMTLEQASRDARWNNRMSMLLITIITVIALALAAVGLYAVASHAVAARTAEIGLRLALGASPGRITWLVVRRAARQLIGGLAAGAAGVVLWGRLFGGGPGPDVLNGPVRIVLVSLAIALLAVTACLAPVRRIATVDPARALRAE